MFFFVSNRQSPKKKYTPFIFLGPSSRTPLLTSFSLLQFPKVSKPHVFFNFSSWICSSRGSWDDFSILFPPPPLQQTSNLDSDLCHYLGLHCGFLPSWTSRSRWNLDGKSGSLPPHHELCSNHLDHHFHSLCCLASNFPMRKLQDGRIHTCTDKRISGLGFVLPPFRPDVLCKFLMFFLCKRWRGKGREGDGDGLVG